MNDALSRLLACLDRGLPAVYCAVVETRGSTPQKAGAAMLVFPDGTQAGTLGGGCVEAEVKRRALHALPPAGGRRPHVPARPRLRLGRRPDLRRPDDRSSPTRVRRIGDAATTTARCSTGRARRAASPRPSSSATRPACPSATATCSTPPARRSCALADAPVWEAVTAHLPRLTQRSRPATVRRDRLPARAARGSRCSSSAAGTSARRSPGWRPRSASRLGRRRPRAVRQPRAVPGRRPAARRRHRRDAARARARTLTAGDLRPDRDPRARPRRGGAVPPGRRRACGYVGMIGSRRKIRLIFDDLVGQGRAAGGAGPRPRAAGLDIGSQTVPEIAVSIVAELIACRNLGTTRRAVACTGRWAR